MYKPTTSMWHPSASFLFKLSILTTAVTGLGLTTGCTSTPTIKNTSSKSAANSMGMLDASSLDSLEGLLSATDMRAVEGDRLLILKHGDLWKRMTVGFKMDETKWDPRIDAQRSWFISRQPYLDRLSARASRYLYHTVKEAERRGMPTELALLPVIESSYDPAATSSASAAGMWQFIPSTGRIYGLRQTSLYDGRRDVVESTRAAYEFLSSLYNQFGSWELALAAYNAGPGRIQQAINRNQAAGLPTDYWSLRLPQETMNYVPRFLAVAQIIKSPQNYGVSLPPIANRPHFREVSVPAGVSLSEVASLTGLSRAELYQLNPGHRGEIVDPQSTLRILIPADLNPNVDQRIKALKPSTNTFWASNTPSDTPVPSTSVTTSIKTTTTATPVYTAQTTTPKTVVGTSPSTSSSVPTRKVSTPTGSDALAAFASSAAIPSAPRIPVAVTQASNIKPVRAEPQITAEERAKILASLEKEISDKKPADQVIANVINPQASQADKDEVVREIKAIAPQGTEIVDPLDGKIKLTAIQTSQSVASQRGSDVKIGFSYPKAVAENTSANSDEAKRNKDKSFKQTESEVVVVPPKGQRSTYTVMSGDTLAIIAMKNGVNWRDIAKWNQVDPSATLYVGATLYLYDAKPNVTSVKNNDDKPATYTVKANDSLTSVANQFNLTVSQLAEMNGLNTTSNLFVGQKLSLIKSSNPKIERDSNPKIATKSYTVKRGEFLKLIADRYALSNQELASLTSGLKADSNLYVGQKINVPLEEVNLKTTSSSKSDLKADTKNSSSKSETRVKTENYTVQRGDTLNSIASKSKITVAELAELNGFSTSKGLIAGQAIKIPEGSTLPEIYTVQSGESLNVIANKFDMTISQLAGLNGLSSNSMLQVGQKLKLTGEPESKTSNTKTTSNSKSDTDNTHKVTSGETLASIARKYKLTVNELSELNGLKSSSVLQVGQTLKLTSDNDKRVSAVTSSRSSSSSKNTEAYTVKAGESLNAIASRLGLSAKELADLNGLSVRSGLQRGQTIQVPKTYTDYKVRGGDSLNRIANKFGVDVDQLAEMNGLKASAPLQIGVTIKVPN